MKSIRIKLALFFILIMCISSMISLLMSTIVSNNTIRNELKLTQQSIGIAIIELKQKTDLNIDDIVKMISNFMYDVNIVENIEDMNISKEEFEKIQNEEIVFLSPEVSHAAATLLMVDNNYIKISLHPQNNIFKIVISRVGFTLASYVIIGAILIIILGKRAVKSILKLKSATQEVAKGNFDIQIENNSNDEIGQLTDNFNKMAKELKSIEYLRKDFINNVSHEFRTPIASIQGFAKLLQTGNLSEEERQEYAAIIVEETSRLSKLSSNILKLSKLENQEIIEKKVLFSLDEQIRKSILLLEYEWSKKEIDLDIELESVKFSGDEELLQQVWINLLSNAIKFSNQKGTITVRLYQAGSIIKVIISDNGIGMDEEIQERIFEKFYQGNKSHCYEGNGLGLSLVKRILDICGGIVRVKSALGKGSTFTVELPLEK